MIELRGMTWDHPRGVDPLVAHAKAWEEKHGVKITWDARLLEDFETYPLDELAKRYDLLVIDHPHVGMAAAHGDCLLPFEVPPPGETVGRSHESYFYDGKQWALAIDAAAQVACKRWDAPQYWPANWDEVLELAQQGRVIVPMSRVHALMAFFTLCANRGHPCAASGPQLIDRELGASVLDWLQQFGKTLPKDCFNINPIGAFNWMKQNNRFLYCPLVYGYVTYARRPAELKFGDVPGVIGSTLGGTGIAVSAKSKHRDIAVAVAHDLASAETQRGLYAQAGGQPAHRSAWTDRAINKEFHNFYRHTIATLDAAYVRPRFDGYIAFQHSAGALVAVCADRLTSVAKTIDRINDLFAEAQGLSK